MIALVSAILGFLTSMLPALIKIFEKKQDYKHELELKRLEIEAAREGIALQTRMEQIKALIEQNRAIYTHDSLINGNSFINNLRASVRPVLTYSFFIVFCIIKLISLAAGISISLPLDKLVALVWDDYTATIFSAIISFWFGSRLWEKTDLLNNVITTGTVFKRTDSKE